MNSDLKIQKPGYNLVSMFSSITLETEEQRKDSKKLYGTYPYESGIGNLGLGDFNELPQKSIESFSEVEISGLKTIVAHMCEVGTEVREVYSTISKCNKAIRSAKEEIKDAETGNFLVSLAERELELFNPKKTQLLTKMQILVALLIKDSYCMERAGRTLILDFLAKAAIGTIIDEALTGKSNMGMGIVGVYCNSSPYISSGLGGLAIQTEVGYVNVFAFNSDELKPKELPAELEEEWPFEVK